MQLSPIQCAYFQFQPIYFNKAAETTRPHYAEKEGFSKILTSTRPALHDIAKQSSIKPAHVL